MGPTKHRLPAERLKSCGLFIEKRAAQDKIIALAGNPNVGKSTVFNSLTGLNQHTGNWPGKTVVNAQGRYRHRGQGFILVDLPGTYSLVASSLEEEVARDFICFGGADAVVIVADATCLERNLNLVLQIIETTERAVLCVNLIDEAQRKGIRIQFDLLAARLGIPVVATDARSGEGLERLMEAVSAVTDGSLAPKPLKILYDERIETAIADLQPAVEALVPAPINPRWAALKLLIGDDSLLTTLNDCLGFDLAGHEQIVGPATEARRSLTQAGFSVQRLQDQVVTRIVQCSETIGRETITFQNKNYTRRDRSIDKILTSKTTGIPIMIALLFVIFWLTITGANYPSDLLARALFSLEDKLRLLCSLISVPAWITGPLLDGVYRTLAWVVSVMLPPMAIFFPLFTLLEDSGYLARIAFNLDDFFRRAGAHGKQALTMCMGFGCNAAGIIGCRIINSPRERLIAILTNNFVPCNGRFPILIAVTAMFFAGHARGVWATSISTLMLTGVIVLGVVITVFMSRLLSRTVLRGLPSSFNLELPPYRRPQIGRVIVRSVLDRTLFVLGRAVVIAAPAGLIIWLLANMHIGPHSMLTHSAALLDPLGRLLGLDGYILMAFILGFPANEIVIPLIIMSYTATGTLTDPSSLGELHTLLISQGWTWLTAVCTMLFTLMHWPCGTTLLTIKKETQSPKWTLVSFALPSLAGMAACLFVATVARLLGLA